MSFPEIYRCDELQYDTLPVNLCNTNTCPDGEWRSVLFVKLEDLKRGDVLQVSSTCQVVNDLCYWVEMVHAHCLMPPPRPPLYGSASPMDYSTIIGSSNGNNVGHDIHYWLLNRSFWHVMSKDMSEAFIHLRLRARAPCPLPGDQVFVKHEPGTLRGYSEMTVALFRKDHHR